MTSILVDKDLLFDLLDSKLKLITDTINTLLSKWNYTSADLFLRHAADGTLQEAEPDAISLRNILDKRDELQELKISWSKN